MLHSTDSKQGDTFNGSESTNENPKVTYLNNEIEGAKPLRLVGNEEQGYCVVFGKYRITDIHKTPEDAEKDLKDEPWQAMINLVAAIQQQISEAITKDTNK